jgi:hypothetical protein
VNDRKDRPPNFEFKAAARAREATFRAVGDVEWRTEGTARVERTGRRAGLPSPVRPHIRYTDVRVSTHIKAWLDETRASMGKSTRSARVDPHRHAYPGVRGKSTGNHASPENGQVGDRRRPGAECA